MNSYLLLAEVSEKTTNLVTLISIIVIALLIVVLTAVCFSSKKVDTKTIVYGALCVSASFVLSFIKIAPVTYGGSITLASFVPLLIFAYSQGVLKGLIVGLVFGVLNFIQSPYILVPITFVLDYLLAFSSIALMGLAKKFTSSTMKNVVLGTILVYLVRFTFHFLSGLIYFKYGAIWANLPSSSAIIYSLLYQVVYILPDMLICLVALIAIVKSKQFDRLCLMVGGNSENK